MFRNCAKFGFSNPKMYNSPHFHLFWVISLILLGFLCPFTCAKFPNKNFGRAKLFAFRKSASILVKPSEEDVSVFWPHARHPWRPSRTSGRSGSQTWGPGRATWAGWTGQDPSWGEARFSTSNQHQQQHSLISSMFPITITITINHHHNLY